METDCFGIITLNHELCNIVHSTDVLEKPTFITICKLIRVGGGNREWLYEMAILAPTNETVGQINEKIMSHVKGDVSKYPPVDNILETKQVTSYPVEFLNSLELSGVPSHKLRLKVGVPVLLMYRDYITAHGYKLHTWGEIS